MQKLIVAQINGGTNDGYSGDVHYNPNATLGGAPWFDWGPYLWASGDVPRNDGVFWCGGQQSPSPCIGSYDVRDGDDHTGQFWGDYTHPREHGQLKVANQVRYFLTNQGSLLGSQSFITDWVTPWISK